MKKEMNNWSILGILTGFTLALGSFIRYWIIYPDYDKALAYFVIGALICSVFWLYDKTKRIEYEITAMGDWINDKDYEWSKRR